ncbi:MAG TPA: MFS transporter [Anaerolineae bacterium]|jgi:MFS family permease
MQLYLSHMRSFTREARLFLVTLTVFAFAGAIPGVFFTLYLQALGFDRYMIGLTTTATQLGGVLASIPAAALLDVIGRRKAAIIGAIATLVTTAATLLVSDPSLVIAAQVISGSGIVLYALAVVPLLASVSTVRERTTLFSTVEGCSTLALFFGSLVAGVLPSLAAPIFGSGLESAETYRAVMLGSLIIRAVGIFPLALIHDHANAHASNVARQSTLSFFNPRVLLKLKTPIWKLALPILLTYLGGSLIFPFINLYLKGRFGASDVTLGFIQGATSLAIGLFAFLGPFAADRFGRARVVIAGTLITVACLVLIGYVEWFEFVAVIIVLRAGLYNGILPLYRAYVIDQTPSNEVAVVNLIYSTAANVGPTVAPPISGYVQDRAGFGPLFVGAIALYGMAAAGYYCDTWIRRGEPA